MKKYCIYILIAFMAIGCEKEKNNDLSGSEKIFGRLFIIDPLASSPAGVPQAGKKLTIRYADSQDHVNYLFSTTSDATGYFEFSNLQDGRLYIIKYQETISGALYEDSISVTAPTNTAVLSGKLATAKQAGMLVEVKDFSGNLLKEATVCVFTSESNIGYSKGICDGSMLKLTTNSAGKASHVGLAPGPYYLLATATVDGVIMTGKTKIDVTNSVAEVKIQVQKPRGISLVVTNPSGGLLKDATVCLFNSAADPAYEKGVCEGSLYTATTNAQGIATFSGIPAGTYYAVINATELQMPLQGRTVITVKDNIEELKITLSKPNGIHFITTDANSEAIGNASVCVFTSNILFQGNSCEGSSIQLTTDVKGKTDLFKLDKGTYYVYGSKIVGKDTLVAKNIVTVGDQIVECPLKLVKK